MLIVRAFCRLTSGNIRSTGIDREGLYPITGLIGSIPRRDSRIGRTLVFIPAGREVGHAGRSRAQVETHRAGIPVLH